MLEHTCHLLDIKLAAYIATNNGDIQHNELDQYIAVHQKARELEISSEMINEQISLVQEALTTAIMNDPDNEDQIKEIYNARLNHLNKKMNDKVRNYIQYIYII